MLEPTSPNHVLGIDPGKNGGLAFLSLDGTQALVFPMPTTERDVYEMLSFYSPGIKRALIEKVHSMPKQGVASSFKFGVGYGFLRGLLTALLIPFDEAAPQTWQKALGCLSHGNKNVTKAKAQQFWPKLRITHATADALLIAEYARRKEV